MLIEEPIELANKICKQKAEEQTIELKSAQTGCPKRLYDTLSSFSNQDNGGILVFGIDENDDFQVVSIYDPQDLQKKITEQCLQMEPPVRAVFTLAEYQGKTICAAEIPAIDITERPCYYRGAGRTKGSYIRVGNLPAFCREPKTRQEIAAFLGVKTVFYAMQHYVQPLLTAEKLARTIPEKPKSRNQKYYTVR